MDINGDSSESSTLKYGVSEGSILRMLPLGDIMRKHKITFHSHADDTDCTFSLAKQKLKHFMNVYV